MKVRELERILLDDGWHPIKQIGSHRQYKNPTKPGKVTVPIHTGDLDKGTVKSIETGSVNAIVHIDIGNGNIISSTISIDAVKELGLAVGKEAYAIIKATSVMVGVE